MNFLMYILAVLFKLLCVAVVLMFIFISISVVVAIGADWIRRRKG